MLLHYFLGVHEKYWNLVILEETLELGNRVEFELNNLMRYENLWVFEELSLIQLPVTSIFEMVAPRRNCCKLKEGVVYLKCLY